MPRTVPPVVAEGMMTNAAQPAVIVDDALTLRAWDIGDADAVVVAFTNPEIQHWHGYRVDDLDEAHAWVSQAQSSWREERTANWAIVGGNDEVFGRVALHTNLGRGVCEIAYWILPEARARDIATRAAVAATTWAHQFGFHRVELQHSIHNLASCRVATKAGFTAEGTHRGKDLHADGWHDMHQHSHLSTDH
jgi:RimJ/RimL family protein N-acetyltransferase